MGTGRIGISLAVVGLVWVWSGPVVATELLGKAVSMGNGTARLYVQLDTDHKPLAFGLIMDADALQGLPAIRNRTSRCYDLDGNGKINDQGECEGDTEIRLTPPAALQDRGDIPFRWIMINWNPTGHPPMPWSVPHFDFHFYMVDQAAVDQLRTGPCGFFMDCQIFKRATKPVPAKYVPSDHINVDAAVATMGNHLIDSKTPELAKPPQRQFTHTWIFGVFDGHITFYEPMITHEYLMSRPDICTPIKQPAAFEVSGFYPRAYCIRYVADRDAYTVSLEDFIYRDRE